MTLNPSTRLELNDVRESVASALNVSSKEIEVDHWRYSPGLRSTRCWGISRGRKFFSKTLAVDPYPLVHRFGIPENASQRAVKTFRSAREQIETEWVMTQRLRRLVGPHNVPEPLGRSVKTKTVVWEQATGARMDDTVKHSRWIDPKGSASAAALFQTGSWLRKLHDATAHDEESINFDTVIRAVSQSLEAQGLAASRYAQRALHLLEGARRYTGGDSLQVSRVLSHGDFTLANLLWDKKANHVWVVDFEDFTERTSLHDLVTIIFDLRVLLLNPFVPKRVIAHLEKSFWNGYGEIAQDRLIWVNASASSRIFYYYLPRLSARRRRRGWVAGGITSVYKTFFETSMIARSLSGSLSDGHV